MSSKRNMIGLLGRKGAGKDTAAGALIDEGYANVKFAGALKVMIRALLAYQGADEATIERMIEGDLKEVPTPFLAGRTPRHAMQTLGTEWGRDQIADDLWVRIAINMASMAPSVITDTRFPNEVEAVQEAGGIVFGISADWIAPTIGEHPSEAMIDDLIDALPEGQKITNHRATGNGVAKAIQEFRWRFLELLRAA